MRYVRVETDAFSVSQEIWWQRILHQLLVAVIPLANPDFEHVYPNVRMWLLELNADNVPQREVGLDEAGTPLVIGPFEKNYGVWTDPGEPLGDIPTQQTTEEHFERAWAAVAATTRHRVLTREQ